MKATSVPAPPVRPSARAAAELRPLPPARARVHGGFWGRWQDRNGRDAIRSGYDRLEEAGTLQNFRIAAGAADGPARGMIFQDSDAYKWLEALAFEIGRTGDEQLLALQREVTSLVAAAQAEDGYLNSVHQLRHPRAERYANLAWNHELYCYGHLMQAAIAQVRATRDDALLQVSLRVLDHLCAVFGPDANAGVPGHPEIEMALIELYRETGRDDALDLARFFLDGRGRGSTADTGPGPSYFSDRVPVRDATTVEGHAVRALYLAAGATDLAVEDGDSQLLGQQRRLFASMLASRTYVTGGLGSRWDGESFGAPYELSTDRAYAETCAGIAAVQWAWRLLLATGDVLYADAIERFLYNAVLPGVSLSGTAFFYVNSLQLRDGDRADENRSIAHGRRGWFDCACCPPNVMRTIASFSQYVATADDTGLQFHQYASGTWSAPVGGGLLVVEVSTDYPHDGTIRLHVDEAPPHQASIALRVPAWAHDSQLTVDGQPRPLVGPGAVRIDGVSSGQEIVLSLGLAPRFVTAPHRVDASRGAVAVERGPLVYALEQVDQAGGALVDDALVDPSAAVGARRIDDLDGVVALDLSGWAVPAPSGPGAGDPWPYRPWSDERPTASPCTWTAIPYYAWANRGVGPMRVWLPVGRAPDGKH